eukprot:4215041-Prymnesium_polylepis.1
MGAKACNKEGGSSAAGEGGNKDGGGDGGGMMTCSGGGRLADGNGAAMEVPKGGVKRAGCKGNGTGGGDGGNGGRDGSGSFRNGTCVSSALISTSTAALLPSLRTSERCCHAVGGNDCTLNAVHSFRPVSASIELWPASGVGHTWHSDQRIRAQSQVVEGFEPRAAVTVLERVVFTRTTRGKKNCHWIPRCPVKQLRAPSEVRGAEGLVGAPTR